MGLFYFLLAVDGVAALVFVFFFVIGIGDGTVSLFNITLWLTILTFVTAIITGGVTLNRYGHRAIANSVLAVLAVPALFYGLFFIMLIIIQPRWN